jgi:hypothetical protein
MSSTGRAADRIALDDYPTPRWCVHRLLEAYELPGGLWLEPCAGAGAIIRAVAEVRGDVRWHANEINPVYRQPLEALLGGQPAIGDALKAWVPPITKVIITNPPFGPSLELLLHFLQYRHAVTVFLQRLNWAAGPRRHVFRTIEPSVYVLPDRPSFVDTYEKHAPQALKAQTDSIEYAWFVFDGRGGFRVLGDTPDTLRRAEIEEGRANGMRPRRLAKPKHTKEAA